jgi:hypothetical protein
MCRSSLSHVISLIRPYMTACHGHSRHVVTWVCAHVTFGTSDAHMSHVHSLIDSLSGRGFVCVPLVVHLSAAPWLCTVSWLPQGISEIDFQLANSLMH